MPRPLTDDELLGLAKDYPDELDGLTTAEWVRLKRLQVKNSGLAGATAVALADVPIGMAKEVANLGVKGGALLRKIPGVNDFSERFGAIENVPITPEGFSQKAGAFLTDMVLGGKSAKLGAGVASKFLPATRLGTATAEAVGGATGAAVTGGDPLTGGVLGGAMGAMTHRAPMPELQRKVLAEAERNRAVETVKRGVLNVTNRGDIPEEMINREARWLLNQDLPAKDVPELRAMVSRLHSDTVTKEAASKAKYYASSQGGGVPIAEVEQAFDDVIKRYTLSSPTKDGGVARVGMSIADDMRAKIAETLNDLRSVAKFNGGLVPDTELDNARSVLGEVTDSLRGFNADSALKYTAEAAKRSFGATKGLVDKRATQLGAPELPALRDTLSHTKNMIHMIDVGDIQPMAGSKTAEVLGGFLGAGAGFLGFPFGNKISPVAGAILGSRGAGAASRFLHSPGHALSRAQQQMVLAQAIEEGLPPKTIATLQQLVRLSTPEIAQHLQLMPGTQEPQP